MKPTMSKATAGTAYGQPHQRRCWRRTRTVVAGIALAVALTTVASASSPLDLVAINFGNSTGGDGLH
jgi:hypothetical protein